MMARLQCVASSNRAGELDEQRTNLINLCGREQALCRGISGNGTTGKYGAYTGCNVTEQLSWALNQHFVINGNDDAA